MEWRRFKGGKGGKERSIVFCNKESILNRFLVSVQSALLHITFTVERVCSTYIFFVGWEEPAMYVAPS